MSKFSPGLSETKTIKFEFKDDSRFTGRQISSKLVISKNKDSEGKNRTLVFVHRKGHFYFVPIADIYLDVNKHDLIMPKGKPVPVSRAFNTEMVKSSKYEGYYVLAPDSDFEPVFKEVETSNGLRFWFMVFDKITFHLYTWTDFDDDPFVPKHKYLSRHQLHIQIKEDIIKERLERMRDDNSEYQSLNDELFEEAGYDFMD